MHSRSFLGLAVLSVSLAGCGHVPVSTMWALRNFDMVRADPTHLRVAVRLPEALIPQPGGVKVTARWGRKGEPQSERTAEIVLQETSVAAEGAGLTQARRAGTRLFAYKVASQDVERLRALQLEVARTQREGQGRETGALGVSADACRTGELPAGALAMTTFLKVDSEREYLTLLKDVDLRTLASGDKSLDNLVPACGKFAHRVESAKAP